jgi:hypothetical protein
VRLAYEYGYGFDGGRRWRKDTVNGVWTRYPCGVACGAGELVEQTSDLSGGQWTTSALYLQGISLVRRNNEWHHFDPLGTAQVITNNSASVISNNLYDVFGVLRYEQGSAQTPWRWKNRSQADEGFLAAGSHVVLPERGLFAQGVGLLPSLSQKEPNYWQCVYQCVRQLWKYRGFPEVDWACLAASVCCAADPEPVTKSICCGISTACLGVRAAELLTIIKFCLLKCLVDRKPIAAPVTRTKEVVMQ